MTITPGIDFAKSTHGRAWQEVVGEAQFQEAAKAAMLEYASEQSTSAPAELGWRIQGAQGFLRKLMSLGQTVTEAKRTDTINLVQ